MRKNPTCFLCNVDSKLFLAENDYFYSILDKYPVSPGHTLVVPKPHIASLEGPPSFQGAATVKIIQKILSELPVQTLRDFYSKKVIDPKSKKSKVLCEAAPTK